ncbi:MAG: hypothetical protein RL196_96 [Actinomycetota bacterium]|jgi:Fic-DOC domain mobile mystery protein B
MSKDDADSTLLEVNQYLALIPSWVTNRVELNVAEFAGILKFRRQVSWSKMSKVELLDDLVLRNIHRAMFGDVWLWAGAYRTRELNLGLHSSIVSVAVKNLIDDSKHWFTSTNEIQLIEDACRLHHRLVEIHPFLNGNGRLSREYTNLILKSLAIPAFTWGVSFVSSGLARNAYIKAIKAADDGDLEPLMDFVYE